jgi:iron complex outermembrane receptor protein
LTAAVTLWAVLADVTPSVAATVSGKVRARDGARLPFSTLVVTDTRTGAQWRVVGGELGTFRVSGLPPGEYEVRAESPGFRTLVVPQVAVRSEEDEVTIDAVLDIEAVREELTVTAAAPRDSVESAAIRGMGARDVGEALTATSGIWQLRKGAIANEVVLRGLQSRDMNVLIDGERTYGACPNHMDPPAFHVDFAEVERIEVAKGPFDVRYQGSLGGVVNVVTRRPEQGWHANVSLGLGAAGYANPSAVASYGGRSWFVLGGGSFRRADPYRDGDDRLVTELTNYTAASREDEAFRVASGWGRGALTPGQGQSIQLSYARQQATHVIYPYLQMDAMWDTTDRAGLRYERARAWRLDAIQAQAYFTRVDHWMTDEFRVSSAGMARGYSMGTDAETQTLGGRAEATVGGVTGGLEAVRRRWDARTQLAMRQYAAQASIPDVVIDSVGAFVDWRTPLGASATLEAGGRLDHVSSEADEAVANTNLYFAYHGTRSASRADVLPAARVRLAWQAGPWQVGAGLGHVARVAEGNERYFALQRAGTDWVGNPDLAPARNTGLELSGAWTRGGATVGVQSFVSRVDGYIAVYDQSRRSMVPGVMNARARSYANVDARLTGVEANASMPLGRRVFLSGDLSYVRGSQSGDTVLGIAEGPLAEMPALRGRARLRFDDGRWYLVGEEMVTADQDRVDADLGEQPTPGAAVTNLSGGVRWGALSVTVGVTNLFDRLYVDALSYQRDPFRLGVRLPEPGRQWFTNIAWRF